MALVSIIIPTYNRADLIGITLDSILRQSYSNWECIIVDDGSVDYTAELLELYSLKDKRIKYHQRPLEMPKGANSCRNYGFTLSKGEFINWFDDDDIMLSGFLEIKINSILNHHNFLISSGHYFDDISKSRRLIKLKKTSNLYKDFILWNYQILTPSVIFRKDFLKNKFLFRTELSRGQEAEFFSRIFYKAQSCEYKVVDTPLFLYRQHSQSVSFLNHNYVEENKESEAFFYVENFKRSIRLNDEELINFTYQKLLKLFFLAINSKHIINANYILKNLAATLAKLDLLFSLEIFFLGKISLFLRKSSYKIEKRWRNFHLNFS
ncbi:glycosyltransferase family 2 protein [Gramella sp. GC03-9]|uniref:Glycosyltransferase family 2 protein n=1 Tax=Christiangramia oceanisediminis TaxID=2920386 RepID=A0A9X2HZ54_9FLAO|nr:glycosyltransferase family A protein [Gramella oceanisediminis]MCP9198319.1 glycosyltransferase family 2 protein [Gramella oceanisediminis]